MKRYYENNKLKISAPLWNEEFELLDGYQTFKIILNIC